jgi:uncharacterized membrane protein required for colicin V production
MTVWILALLLLACCAALGYRQGAIRVVFSFVGIIFAVFLAGSLGKPFAALLPHVGVKQPVMVWAIAPLIAYALVLTVFKIAGFFVHRKVELHYKYHMPETRLALYERMNHRLGACAGILNGTAYFILISFVLFNLSYWTVQVASSESEPAQTRLVNLIGRDLQSTRMARPAAAVSPMSPDFYRIGDLAGLIYQNPNAVSRLASYPAFISIAQRDDLQQLSQDETFTNAWAEHATMATLTNTPSVQAIVKDSDLLNTVWSVVKTNLDDITIYLKTGKSPKYDGEKMIGVWDFNANVSVAQFGQLHPKTQSSELRAMRSMWGQAYANTTFEAGTDGQAFLLNAPDFKDYKPGQPMTTETWKGQWSNDGGTYTVTLSSNGENKTYVATVDDLRLTLKDDSNVFVFDRD